MPAEKAIAIVLRLIEFSETSVVGTLFTREFGKIHALAKGARRPKGPFESALDLLALCRIVFLRKSSDALDLLTEAKLERRFRAAGRDLSRLYAGYYVAELLNELTHDYDPHPELFDAGDSTLKELAGGDESAASLVLRFELSALRLLGHLPSLESCVECGSSVEITSRVPFSQIAGGVLCPQCRTGQRGVVSVSAGVVRTMAGLANSNSSAKRIELDDRTRGEMRAVLNHYISHLLGHRPRMHEYLRA